TSLEAFLRFSGKLIFYLATACGARGKFLQKFCREFCDSRRYCQIPMDSAAKQTFPIATGGL
ncbi:MAG: hypothetical protein LBT98_01450, partial [Puniceicoccales bacterium]|nr:hypothetical protein [Puniceicoccales bacterium]